MPNIFDHKTVILHGWIDRLLLAALVLITGGCKKFIQIPPPATLISSQNVYTDDATAASVLSGIYAAMSNADNSLYSPSVVFLCGGLSADELTLYDRNNLTWGAFYLNKLTAVNPGIYFWGDIYSHIFAANSAMEGLTASTDLTPGVKKQLLGEAYFIRAFSFFYIVNLYGDAALPLTSDYKKNALIPRAPIAQVYTQIISDLTTADSLLSAGYLDGGVSQPSTQRVRPTKSVAEAFLARVYLYYANLTGDAANYAKAVTESSNVIGNPLYSLDSLDDVFLANSTETIWSLQPVSTYITSNTGEGMVFDLPSTGPSTDGSYPVYLSQQMLNAFEPGDQRFVHWVDSVTVGATTYYYSYKYKQPRGSTTATENIMVFRLAEQYLIRAEAELGNNDAAGAVNDLNVIRRRAGLPDYNGATDAASLEAAILHERQVELFTEWGHRWLDLKRTKTVDAVMSIVCPLKGTTWNTHWQLYPIQLSDIREDLNLVQNAGY